MAGPTYTLNQSQLSIPRANSGPVFKGTQQEAQTLLVELANRFVGNRGVIVKGNFRLVMNADGGATLKTRRFWHSSANDDANRYIKSLAHVAYGKPAETALSSYLGDRNTLGSHSFVKMVQSWRNRFVSEDQRTEQVDTARVKTDARLRTVFLNERSVRGPATAQASPHAQANDGLLSGPPGDRNHPQQQPASEDSEKQLIRAKSSLATHALQAEAKQGANEEQESQIERTGTQLIQQPALIVEEPLNGQQPALIVEEPLNGQQPLAGQPPSHVQTKDLKLGKLLGSGSFGEVHEVSIAGQPGFVLKALTRPIVLSLVAFEQVRGKLKVGNSRDPDLQESMAVYLQSQKNPQWSSDLKVTAPTHYLISRNPQAPAELLTTQQTHDLLKTARARGSVVSCVGQVMEKAPGENLGELIKTRSLTADDHKAIARSMITTLKKLAERGFIHRDIKPDNLFYDRASGSVTFIDTGFLYKMPKPERGDQLVQSDSIMGSPNYMSPMMLAKKAYGADIDLHSTAITLLEAAYPDLTIVAQDYLWEVRGNHAERPEQFVDGIDEAFGWALADTGRRQREIKPVYGAMTKALASGATLSRNSVAQYHQGISTIYQSVRRRNFDSEAQRKLEAVLLSLRPLPDPARPDALARLQTANAKLKAALDLYVDREQQALQFAADSTVPGSVAYAAVRFLSDANTRNSPWKTRTATAAHLDALLNELDPPGLPVAVV
jgi:serine/threonine protein kinase